MQCHVCVHVLVMHNAYLYVAGTARPRFFFPFGTVYWMHLARCLETTGTLAYGPSTVSSRTRSGKTAMKSRDSDLLNTLKCI